MRIFRMVLMLSGMFFFGKVAEAQLGIYGTFTSGQFTTGGSPWMYGGTFGVYRDHGLGLVALGVDARGEFLRSTGRSGGDSKLDSGLAGVRVAITPHILPVKPYAEGLVGGGRVQSGGGTAITSFQYRVLGGLDYTFFPRLDWRVVEFGYGGATGDASDAHPRTLSTGLVFRVPF
jgi:hypothetical protein